MIIIIIIIGIDNKKNLLIIRLKLFIERKVIKDVPGCPGCDGKSMLQSIVSCIHEIVLVSPLLFTVHPEGDRVTFLFDEGDAGDVVNVIMDNCNYERNTFEEFYYFSHNNLEIVVNSDGTYMSIDILE